MIYAIVEISGKQLWVEPSRYYRINHIKVKEKTTILLNKVLLFKSKEETQIGEPYLSNTSVPALVVEHTRGPKLIIYKMKPKKKTRRKKGHRQKLTKILIGDKLTN